MSFASNDVEISISDLFVHCNGFSQAVFKKSMNVSIASGFAAWKWVPDSVWSVNTSDNA